MKRHTSAARARTLPLLAAAAAALFLASCEDVILASVQEERKVTGADYFKDTRVSGVERIGDVLVASTLGLYHKTGTTWQEASGFAGEAVGLAKTATHFYAASSDGKVYRSADGASWTVYAASPADAGSIEAIFDAGSGANEKVFASVRSGSTHTLYDITAGTWSVFVAAQATPFAGVVYDGATPTAYYWAATAKNLFRDGIDQSLALGTRTISALGVFDGNVQIATFDPKATENAHAQVHSGAAGTANTLKSGDAGIRISAFASVPESASDNLLVLGTAAYGTLAAKGYLEASDSAYAAVRAGGDATALLAGTATNFDTTLSGKTILGLEYVALPGGKGALYARTYSAGLWKNEWSGSAWSAWSAE